MGGEADRTILLIDDEECLLAELRERLTEGLAGEDVKVKGWQPRASDELPKAMLEKLAPKGTALVVTDYNLTKRGMRGLEGPAVESWCRNRFIPVGQFSRGHVDELPREPGLFSMRVPERTGPAVKYIVAVYRGFKEVRERVGQGNWSNHTISSITAEIMGCRHCEPAVSLYFSRLGSSTGGLGEYLRRKETAGEAREALVEVLCYVIGHVILNLILGYPGPVLPRETLAAYLAVPIEEAEEVVARAGIGSYEGPFSEVQPLVWRKDVDEAMEKAVDVGAREGPLDAGGYNRYAAGMLLGREPRAHDCKRGECGGELGGFWCPFTRRTVCLRADCSHAASAWIPDGADLCRVEAEFYEDYAPLLGI